MNPICLINTSNRNIRIKSKYSARNRRIIDFISREIEPIGLKKAIISREIEPIGLKKAIISREIDSVYVGL